MILKTNFFAKWFKNHLLQKDLFSFTPISNSISAIIGLGLVQYNIRNLTVSSLKEKDVQEISITYTLIYIYIYISMYKWINHDQSARQQRVIYKLDWEGV